MDCPPIGPDEARDLLAPFRAADRVLLAVSGGPDSIALLRLAAALAGTTGWPPMEVGSVDHGMQAGSAEVAAEVAATGRALGLPSHVVAWEGVKPRSGVQAAARAARYGLLGRLARDIGASHLVTAHTLDDQAETILFRMARGSGPAGLVGMRSAAYRDGVVHLRPLLGVPKHRLVATCRLHGWRFVEDPANRDPRHTRSRVRTLMQPLAAEGLDAATLAALAERLAAWEVAVTCSAQALRRRAVRPSSPESIMFDAAVLFAEPAAVAQAVLADALASFGHTGPPRLGRLEALVRDLNERLQAGRAITRTLQGCLIRLSRDARLELEREPPRQRGRRVARQPRRDTAV